MTSDSVQAYDLPERVQKYDAEMDIMHPHRRKMVEIALEVIPFPETQNLNVLDLGVGTGFFSQQMLETYVKSTVVAIDGASAMIELAKVRLNDFSERVEWIVSNFQEIPSYILKQDRFDIVITSYALHHLNSEEKLSILKQIVNSLKPNGWFINADVVISENHKIEQRFQELRVKGVTERASNSDDRFRSAESTRAFLDELEANEQDQPQTLETDLKIACKAGVKNVEVFWREYREVVFGGPVN